jgi:hypothetical protein
VNCGEDSVSVVRRAWNAFTILELKTKIIVTKRDKCLSGQGRVRQGSWGMRRERWATLCQRGMVRRYATKGRATKRGSTAQRCAEVNGIDTGALQVRLFRHSGVTAEERQRPEREGVWRPVRGPVHSCGSSKGALHKGLGSPPNRPSGDGTGAA